MDANADNTNMLAVGDRIDILWDDGTHHRSRVESSENGGTKIFAAGLQLHEKPSPVSMNQQVTVYLHRGDSRFNVTARVMAVAMNYEQGVSVGLEILPSTTWPTRSPEQTPWRRSDSACGRRPRR